MTASRTPVLNRDLLERIEAKFAACKYRPTLVHVYGHRGLDGNEAADLYVRRRVPANR